MIVADTARYLAAARRYHQRLESDPAYTDGAVLVSKTTKDLLTRFASMPLHASSIKWVDAMSQRKYLDVRNEIALSYNTFVKEPPSLVTFLMMGSDRINGGGFVATPQFAYYMVKLVMVLLVLTKSGPAFARFVRYCGDASPGKVPPLLQSRAAIMALESGEPDYINWNSLCDFMGKFDKLGVMDVPLFVVRVSGTRPAWKGMPKVPEIETFGGLKARLVADRCDPRMLPRQITGVCYVHTALNTILNTPALLTAVMSAVKARIDGSKYSSALGGQNLRKLDRRFTVTDRPFVGKVGAVNVRVIKDIINRIGSSKSDEALKQWCKDTILYTALRDAKAADFTKYDMNYGQDESADSLYLAVARQDIMKVYGTVDVGTLVAAGDGGTAVETLFDVLASVGATVHCSTKDFTATFPDGTCFFASRSKVPETASLDAFLSSADARANVKNVRAIEDDYSAWDRTGQIAIRRKHLTAQPNEEGHMVMYFRDDDHVIHVIDSNHHRTWNHPS